MGELFRRFWLPAMLPSELPEPDGTPVRFRILSEDLVAFRDTNGKVGFLAQACPHRGASMFFGRNEECGLRCVYHGWKFDVDGNCVDMPNEPAESNFKHKVQATAYPAAERAGLIWVYMGPKDKQPPLPDYQWCVRPGSENSQVRKWMQESNYTQGLEGNIDSAHVSYLHRTFARFQEGQGIGHGAPLLTVKETDFGFVYGARRPSADNRNYWRITTYVMPTFSEIATKSKAGAGHFVLPMDDEHSWWFYVAPPPLDDTDPVLPEGQLTPGDVNPASDPTIGFVPGTWRRLRNKDNDYLIDREMQRSVNYTGLPGNRTQDGCITESMGTIYDRTKEHLGTTDTAIIFMRRHLMRMARELQQGIEPPMITHPERFRAIPLDIVTAESDFDVVWDAHQSAFLVEGNPIQA